MFESPFCGVVFPRFRREGGTGGLLSVGKVGGIGGFMSGGRLSIGIVECLFVTGVFSFSA